MILALLSDLAHLLLAAAPVLAAVVVGWVGCLLWLDQPTAAETEREARR